MTVDRYAGSVTRRNGAYLVHISHPENDATSTEEFDCASNREVAKRTAIEIADQWYRRPFRWTREGNRLDLYTAGSSYDDEEISGVDSSTAGSGE
jgi:hypothetical protein